MTREELVRSIDAAFAEARHPGDKSLAALPVALDVPSDYAYVARYFRGRHWRDVTLQGLAAEYAGPADACLAFLSPEAYRFYLPAFMRIAIEAADSGDTVADAAALSLIPPEVNPTQSPALTPAWNDRMNGFTKRQVEAIVGFLRWANARPSVEPDDAIRESIEFWSRKV